MANSYAMGGLIEKGYVKLFEALFEGNSSNELAFSANAACCIALFVSKPQHDAFYPNFWMPKFIIPRMDRFTPTNNQIFVSDKRNQGIYLT